ncbi:hypothetical protein [Candidatus Methanocrinis natronophilus]|nr:hypothetical protein [Candidatus Methanocrinis natronophilus]
MATTMPIYQSGSTFIVDGTIPQIKTVLEASSPSRPLINPLLRVYALNV